MPLLDSRGDVTGVIGTYFDITDRKRAEESQALLATAVDQSAETIVITDAAGTISYVNPAFEKATGYTRAEVIGQNPRLLKSGKQDAEFYRQMWTVLSRGEVWNGRFINRRKDGTLFEEEGTISPVRDAAGKIVNYVAAKRDVTNETRLEAQLRQAQKMEAVGSLAGGVAHDFNNLLGVIMGYGEIVYRQLAGEDPLKGKVGQILKAAERAAGLTRQLLAFSRKQVLQPKILDLNAVVSDMDKMLRRLIGEDIELTTLLEPHLGSVRADPGQIEQVVMNLVVNARDAMPEGGRLTIETRNADLDAEYAATHPPARPGPYVVLVVTDTGSGMDAATQARIFEPFFTTKGVGEGHRARSGHGLRHRQAERGVHLGLQRGRRGDDVQDLPPPHRRGGRAGAAAGARAVAPWLGDGAARRRRRVPSRAAPRSPRDQRLHRPRGARRGRGVADRRSPCRPHPHRGHRRDHARHERVQDRGPPRSRLGRR